MWLPFTTARRQRSTVLRTDDLDFELPGDLIATAPARERDAARLLVASRTNPARLEHGTVRDLPTLLRAGDLLILNDTRVIQARFVGTRLNTGGKLPGLYLAPVPAQPPERRWQVLLKGGHLRPGIQVRLGDRITLELLERSHDEPGAWEARVTGAEAIETDAAILSRVGLTPLPPYVLAARKAQGLIIDDAVDRERYQTVFSETASSRASVAAPTAGLHLTPALLAALESAGIHTAPISLDVGTGTFKPVETEFIEQHPMHAERCSIPPATLLGIRATRSAGGRIIAVGTTAARTLETYAALEAANPKAPSPNSLETRILITPGYQWKWVDGLITNFHLPRSTLLAMVGAFIEPSGGIKRLHAVYAAAIAERYRFFSYGDAMLVMP